MKIRGVTLLRLDPPAARSRPTARSHLLFKTMINQKRITKNFIKLGGIDSPSLKEAKIAKEIMRQLKPFCNSLCQDKMGNIIGKINGSGRPIMLAAHMDTVLNNGGSTPTVRNGVIGNWGKGVCGADNKSAIAGIIEALTSLKEDGEKFPATEIVITVQEEIGLFGARELDTSKLKSKQALCFDRGTDVPTVVLASPYATMFTVNFKGKSAHAGAHPEDGRNAIAAAADFISSFKLGRVDKDTTMNFGRIEGGEASNIVPDECMVRGEIRSLRKTRLDQLNNKVKAELFRIKKQHVVSSKLEVSFELPGYQFKMTDPLIKEIRSVHKLLGWKTKQNVSNAGADANIFNGKGIVTVNTGYGARKMHSRFEEQPVRQLVRLAKFIEAFLKHRSSQK